MLRSGALGPRSSATCASGVEAKTWASRSLRCAAIRSTRVATRSCSSSSNTGTDVEEVELHLLGDALSSI